jgi:serine/threonine protein kinase
LTDLGAAHIDNAEIASKVQSHNAHNLTIADGSAAAIGTPGFGAPEQFAGGDISPATDIHALGVFVYSLFDGKLPVLWRGTVRRMTSAVPALRFQSIADIQRSLKRLRLLTTAMKVFALAGLCGILCITAFLFSPNWEELALDNIADKKFFAVDGSCTNVYPCITLRDGKNYVMLSGWRQNPITEWVETSSDKLHRVKTRGRLDIEGSGVLKCPVITATEVHLAPGVTLVTSGRYTPEETNELINAVFVVADGANLIFEN